MAESAEAKSRVLRDAPEVAALLAAAKNALDEGMRGCVPVRLASATDHAFVRYLMHTMGSLPHELLRVVFLDPHRAILGEEDVATGSLDRIAIYPRLILRRALEKGAAAIILAHNHPSGDPTPSAEDRAVTAQLAGVSRLLDVVLLDHIVVTSSAWCSILAERPAP